jgi:hypothetical protein
MKRIWKMTAGSMAVATSSFALGTAERRAAYTPDVFRLCKLGNPERRPHRRLPQAAEAQSQQALPGSDELADRQRNPLDGIRRQARRNAP